MARVIISLLETLVVAGAAPAAASVAAQCLFHNSEVQLDWEGNKENREPQGPQEERKA